MKEIRCGIVYCGTILPWHANPLERIEGAQLVAVADAAKERAQEAAKIYGVDAYEDYQQMLKRDDLDLVHICTTSGTHGTIGLDAISAGKHVLIEKPIEIQLDRIDALIDAAREKGIKLGGVFQMRFYPSTIKLVDAVKSGRFGKIVLAEYENKSMRTVEYYKKDAWRGTWQFDETQEGDAEVMKANVDMNISMGSDPKAQTETAHEACIRSFLEAVREDKTPSVSGEEARKSVELILAIYHSSKTGKWVELPFTT